MNRTILKEIKRLAGTDVCVIGNQISQVSVNNNYLPFAGKLIGIVRNECFIIEYSSNNNLIWKYYSLESIKTVERKYF